jgi:hypothetical protein
MKQKRVKSESDIDDSDDSFSADNDDSVGIVEEEQKMSERIIKKNPMVTSIKKTEVN